MENTQNTPIIKEEIKNNKNSLTGFFIGIIVFLLLLIVTGIVLIFTDLGGTVLERIESMKGGNVEEEIEEEKEPTYTLENEGWSLYSIPEYGFSVEIPPTSSYTQDKVYNRWEISRMLGPKLTEDAIEEIRINYYPNGISPNIRACGQGCNGEMQISVNIYEKDENYNQDRIIEQKEQEYNDFVETHCEIGGPCPENSFEEESEYVQLFDSNNTWCVEMPYIADGDFRRCYFEKDDYLVEIVHTGIDLTDFGLNTMDAQLYDMLESMKFE
jgi:hypothetical protein